MNHLRRNIGRQINLTQIKSSSTSKSSKSHYDLIGPADKISNLRQVKFHIPENETHFEKEYRQKRQQIFEYNQQYWTEQNLSFIESRREFNEKLRTKKRLDEKMSLQQKQTETDSTEQNDSIEMNEFYKEFLNENYHKHYLYNRRWFRMNLSMLWPATRVFFYRLLFRSNKKASN